MDEHGEAPIVPSVTLEETIEHHATLHSLFELADGHRH